MANLGGTFDASQGEEMSEHSLWPDGEYGLVITGSDIKETRSNPENRYLELEFGDFDGSANGRKYWVRLNLWNSSQVAVEIAQKEFTTICRAAGKLQVNDTVELHGIPMKVKIGSKKRKDNGDLENVIRSYKPFQQQPAGGAVTQPAAAAPPQPAAATPPPPASAPAAAGPWA